MSDITSKLPGHPRALRKALVATKIQDQNKHLFVYGCGL